jgi:3-hydroxyacyl-[acyl-carrier-protein] dehydratase
MNVIEHYAPGHPATEGHFAGHPIIPGVVILRDVLRAIRTNASSLGLPSDITTFELRAAKFLRPVLPGASMSIALRAVVTADSALAHFDCTVGDEVTAKGTFAFHV